MGFFAPKALWEVRPKYLLNIFREKINVDELLKLKVLYWPISALRVLIKSKLNPGINFWFARILRDRTIDDKLIHVSDDDPFIDENY